MTDDNQNTDTGAADTTAADNANKDGKNPDNGKQPDPAASGDKKPDDAAAGLYRPKGMADHYLGKDDKETMEKLNAAVLGFRDGLNKKGVPETADGYTLELPDDIKSKVLKLDDSGKDPLLEKMKPILHKNNIPAAAFQELATEFYGAVAEMAGSVDKNADGTPLADFEYKELGGAETLLPQPFAVRGQAIQIEIEQIDFAH